MPSIKWIIIAVVAFGAWQHFQNKPNLEDIVSSDADVILYATSTCGYCKMTRELFAEYDVEYTEYDIERSYDGREQYDKLRGRGVPLIVINDEIIRGFNKQSILKALRGSQVFISAICSHITNCSRD